MKELTFKKNNEIILIIIVRIIAMCLRFILMFCRERLRYTPDIKTLDVEPVNSGFTQKIYLDMATRKNNIVITYKGMIKVPETGEYSFRLRTDRGAVFRIHDATVIDADQTYDSGTFVTSSIILEKGYHPFHLVYARGTKGAPLLDLQWSGADFSFQELETNRTAN